MAIVRKVTLKGDIIKGESIKFDYPQGSEIDLISPTGTKTSYTYPFPDIDTNLWDVGIWTAIISSPIAYGVNQFELIDPTAKVSEYQDLIQIIKDIDQITLDRIKGGGVLSQSIQNKALTYESSEVLMKLRSIYVSRANSLISDMKGLNTGCPIKSVTNFRRTK
ncbi:hypothetical protein DN462_25230 [Citrobacter freundii]|uniref:hypothetical protein n=1 Tax=Citrobacter freundii TaxID=546 RepID=UPI000FE29F91|nr:hypothetical protein [Citrobacter freundii]RWS84188.1 hypothetical protein DN462_25230 [Citrobacter freundii]